MWAQAQTQQRCAARGTATSACTSGSDTPAWPKPGDKSPVWLLLLQCTQLYCSAGQSATEGTDRPGIPLLTADNTQAAAFWQSSAAPPALCAGPPKNVTKWYWLPSPPQGQGVFVGATGVPRKEEGPTHGIHPLLHSL